MKAEIDENGELKVTAETPMESYALANWSDGYFKGMGLVVTDNKESLNIIHTVNGIGT